jgi:capsid protein
MARNRKRKRSSTQPISAAHAVPVDQAFFSGYQGANHSTRRGQIWWPTLDTRQELDAFSREELMRRIRWLYGNTGLVRGFINNAADLIGWLTPQADSGDPDWDDQAEAIFRDRAGIAEAFDVSGKFDFWTAQPMLMRSALKDGDILTVLTESEGGAARVAFYEAHQLAAPDNGGENWIDGIYTQRGRHLAYGLRDPEKDRVAVVSARDAIYCGEFDSPGHHRVIPKLAHAVNHAIDITEVFADLKTGIKTSALFGAVIEKQGGSPASGGKVGLPGAMANVAAGPDGAEVPMASVWGTGGNVARLNPGEVLKILNDGRPHENQMEFVRALVRDMSTGYGLPAEVIHEMSRMTGPGVRFVMDIADRWIKARQKTLRNWCRRVWVYTIAKEISSGRLPMPKDEARWWNAKFIPLRNLTIDRGREASSRMDALDRGYDTEENYHAEMNGTYWQDAARQRIQEIRFKQEECDRQGVPYERAFPPRAGAAAPAASSQAPDPAEEEPARGSSPEN